MIVTGLRIYSIVDPQVHVLLKLVRFCDDEAYVVNGIPIKLIG